MMYRDARLADSSYCPYCGICFSSDVRVSAWSLSGHLLLERPQDGIRGHIVTLLVKSRFKVRAWPDEDSSDLQQ